MERLFDLNQIVRICSNGAVGVVVKLGIFKDVYVVKLMGLDLEVVYSEYELERY